MPVTVCGTGGSAQPVPGYGTLVSVGAAAIEEFLAGKSLSRGAAIAAAGLLGGITYDLLVVCGTDPPADPNLTATDWGNALDYTNPLTQLPALAKVKDWFLRQYWYVVCQCVPGPTPAPPPIGTGPDGAQNPGLGTGLSQNVCQSYFDTPVSYPTGNTQRVIFAPGLQPLNAAAQSITIQWFGLATGGPVQIYPFWGDGTPGNTVRQDMTKTIVAGGSATWTLTVPLGAVSLYMNVNNQGAAATPNTRFDFALYCDTTNPGVPVQPCCPPSSELEALLQQILGLEQAIYAKLRPENYAYGAVHTGLTGAGTIPVVDLAGFKVDLTSGIPTNPELPGTPPYEWSVGWMSVSTPDGMIDEKRITRQHQVWLSQLTPYATVFGYYLNPGFTIDVTELTPA